MSGKAANCKIISFAFWHLFFLQFVKKRYKRLGSVSEDTVPGTELGDSGWI
jgi:hypothetical protein